MSRAQTICVYASSSDGLASAYFEAATELGALIAQRNCTLVYGGGRIGLMGAVARSVHAHGGKVIGVIPGSLLPQGYDKSDELIVTHDLRERKAVMEVRSDAFVVLPGGFGTLEEALEIITLRQLGMHCKPIVLLNVQGFFDHLSALFEHLYEQRFAKPVYRELYHVAHDAAGAMAYLDTYQPATFEPKWFAPPDASPNTNR